MALPTNKISLSKSGFIKSSRLIIKSPLSHTLDAPSAIRRSIYPIREGRLQEAQYGSARSRIICRAREREMQGYRFLPISW